MKPVRFAAAATALLLVGGAALASPPERSAKSMSGSHTDRGDRHHRLDRWTFGWFDRGLGVRCRGPVAFDRCVRPLIPYGYPNPYGIVLPPTGHEYLPDDWSFYLPAYEPVLLYPYRGRARFALPSLNTCPDGVQRCHEDEPYGSFEEPR